MKRLISVVLSSLILGCGIVFFTACDQNQPDPTPVQSVVADVYAPDGAPALSLAQLMNDDMQFGEGNKITYNVVAASAIQTYVTGEDPQAELCVLPVNAAAQLLGEAEVYQMLGTVTHGNIYILSAASKGYSALNSNNLKEELLGKTVGCIQLSNVVGLTLRIVLENHDIPYEVIEDVSQATKDDVVYLLNISDPATMITPAAEYDYMVAAEPVVSTKVGMTGGALSVVGDLQELYGGENGWPQAVLVAKKTFIAENSDFIAAFINALKANESWLASDSTEAQTIIDAIAEHLDGASPTFTANNLTKEVIANCAIRFENAADCKDEVNEFLASLSAVSGTDYTVSDGFYYTAE